MIVDGRGRGVVTGGELMVVSSSLERAPAPIPRNGTDITADLVCESSDIVHTSWNRLDTHTNAARGRTRKRGAGRAGAH